MNPGGTIEVQVTSGLPIYTVVSGESVRSTSNEERHYQLEQSRSLLHFRPQS